MPTLPERVGRIDVLAEQVTVQALIVEVELDNTDEFGVELGFQDSVLFDRGTVASIETISETIQQGGNDQTITQNIISSEGVPGFNFNQPFLGNNTLGTFSAPGSLGKQALANFQMGRVNGDLGFGGLVLSAGSESINILLRALSENRRVEVLSRPMIQALHNQLGSIVVGQTFQQVNGLGAQNTLTGVSQPQLEERAVGIQLQVYGPIAGREGVRRLVRAGQASGSGPSIGSNQPLDAVGTLTRSGLPVSQGDLVVSMTSATDPLLSSAVVEEIIAAAREQANRTRAAVRLPASSRTRMVIAVTDTSGNVLGLHRMDDATVFSIDVAVAKARNMSYYADAGTLQPVDQVPGVAAGTAFTSRTLRFLAEPRFPDGIDGAGAGVFSILTNQAIDPDTGLNSGALGATVGSFDATIDPLNGSVLGYDAFFPGTNFHDLDQIENQNGVVFFPGSAPLYINGQLVGGLGVSGDGVDQDDVVTAAGSAGFEPPAGVARADQVIVDTVRLPYIKFLRNPEG